MALKKPALKRGPVLRSTPRPIAKASRNDFEPETKYKVKSGGAFDRVTTEKKKAELNASRPWNVMVPVGGSLTVYILDDGEPFATYQHILGGGKGRRGRDVPCIQDGPEPCPVCLSEGKQGFYVMYLTAVIPVEKYTKQDGTVVTRHYQKKLLQIKLKMAETWRRIFEEHGSFRGLVLKLHRDNKLDPSSGNQVTLVKKLKESEIKRYALAADIKDKDAKEYIVKSKIDEVYDYKKLFPQPNAEELSKLAGVGAATGGLRLGGEDGDDGVGDGGSEWGED